MVQKHNTEGDKDAAGIFLAAGHASSVREQMESALAEIFVLLVKSNYPFAKRAYGAVAS